MFSPMYLMIEKNKLKKKFKGTVASAIIEALDEEQEERHLEAIYNVLSRFNNTIKILDEEKCQNLERAQKTCFEEVRAKEGEMLSVCKFKVLHRRVKILDLSFDGIDFDEQLMELERFKDDYEERIKLLINDNSKVKNKLEMYAKNEDMDGFKKELNRIEKKIGIDRKMNSQIQLQISKILVGNICDSIFYAVDKEDDPALEAYVPFRVFSKYLINKGFGGVAYRSTRMALAGLQGKYKNNI